MIAAAADGPDLDAGEGVASDGRPRADRRRRSKDVTLDGGPVSGPLVRLVDAQALGDGRVIVENTGAAPVPAVLTTWGVPVEPVPAGGNGYRIERAWYTLDGQQVSPETVAQNTRLAAVLTVTAESDRQARLIVDDPLPAGLRDRQPEPAPLGLRRGARLARYAGGGRACPSSAPTASSRRSTAPAAGSFRLAYIVRAVSPGRFHHPAATVEDMYRPEFRAWTDTGRVEVVPGSGDATAPARSGGPRGRWPPRRWPRRAGWRSTAGSRRRRCRT